jgi:hypothetical protein
MRRQGDGEPRRRRRDMIVGLLLAVGLVLAVAGAMTAALAGLGHRWDWWHFSTGFAVLRWAFTLALAASRSPRWRGWVRPW